MKMKVVTGGVTAPIGFKASGISCGIKKNRQKDLALIYSEVPANCAALFTSNKIQAASVKLTRERIRKSLAPAQAIIVNSGNANCCTGNKGFDDAIRMAKVVAKGLNIKEESVLVASTGVIGKPLPIKKIEDSTPILIRGLSRDGNKNAASSIMTTDSLPKEIALKLRLGGKTVTIGGMAKGAGMIHPHLATMLCFITSDVVITPPALIRAFKNAVNKSFNSITVDGQMSTNDMALILANGLAGNPKVILGTKNFHYFSEGLDLLCLGLAEMIIRDAEGATKFVEIIVKGARNTQDAKRVGFAVANSSLVKTSLFGEDPNWGRIAASVGSSGVNFNPERLKISLGSIEVLRGNSPLDVDRVKLKKVFQKDEIKIVADLNIGSSEAIVYTSDLSTEYVKINARYEV